MMKEFNVLLTGVGGQGVILMSELLGRAAIKEGLKVRGSEILGMAVRGGPVTSIIRLGSEVFGPLIPKGKCDVLVGMEPAEALRNVVYLSKSSWIIVNTRKIVPYTVTLGQSRYPELAEILGKLEQAANKVISLNASQLAEEVGSPISANIVMLGALFGLEQIPIKLETMKGIIQDYFPSKTASVNLKAFESGYQACLLAK